MILALKKPPKIVSIDFNTAAPALAKPEMFPLDSGGRVPGRSNEHGWLAAGVPGVLAGIELAARKYASRPFRDLLAPAIELAEEGFVAGKKIESVVRANAAPLKKDPASAELYFVEGRLPGADDLIRNRDLAGLLRLLAKENSVEPFYRGTIAQKIAAAFHEQGGLVTADDLARYEAVEVEPYELRWDGHTVYTAPLTAGGLTILEALNILQALDRKALSHLEGIQGTD